MDKISSGVLKSKIRANNRSEHGLGVFVLTIRAECSTINYRKELIGMAFSIRLSEEEKALATSYARLHSISVGEAFKRALFDRIEDEYDIAIADEAYDEYVKGGRKSKPISKLWTELDL